LADFVSRANTDREAFDRSPDDEDRELYGVDIDQPKEVIKHIARFMFPSAAKAWEDFCHQFPSYGSLDAADEDEIDDKDLDGFCPMKDEMCLFT
tara:strand:+ start:418 stop:699 length:282 start_codon:yes stop_codon:yes gene_type:complete